MRGVDSSKRCTAETTPWVRRWVVISRTFDWRDGMVQSVRCAIRWHEWGPPSNDDRGTFLQCTRCGSIKRFRRPVGPPQDHHQQNPYGAGPDASGMGGGMG